MTRRRRELAALRAELAQATDALADEQARRARLQDEMAWQARRLNEALAQLRRLGGSDPTLRAVQIQAARWRERAETVARMEEAEYRQRCHLARLLRLHGLGHLVHEPEGVR